ncbi:MAG: 16S rRNA (adenine(1518)-N(6)/adenine(1519)-N(6))-dimethyltransferase RsmA [Puniceicoccales bacterium]|jgi:16S rRNA (adenine1518-N6/adenine1519-N6)-dimethyltransferase|nr:16S rRNA (adenine(1518)-N(6)/adenine(1519)-N(6))-dimethyltransferase RsmA [Puniceicoccales bacterium]
MIGIRSTLSALKDLGCAPNRRLGQNFLIDPNIVKRSVELAEIRTDDSVVEIGPGLGALTIGLVGAGAKVFAVEYDRALYSFLSGKFSNNKSFFLIHGDALEFPVAGLPEDVLSYKIVSNLPYAISTPWLDGILEREVLPEMMVLMLQLETVRRFTSSHGCKNFGAISIFLNSAYRVECVHQVSGKCFYPEPKIASALLVLRKKECPYVFHQKTKALIRYLFNYRRKQIYNVMKSYPFMDQQFFEKILPVFGADKAARPENLGITIWQDLDCKLKLL